MPTRVMPSDNTGTHDIPVKGPAGVMTILALLATFLVVIAYPSTGWAQVHTDHNIQQFGLWKHCTCTSIDMTSGFEWLSASLAMITLGMVCVVLALVASMFYLFFHGMDKNIQIFAVIGTSFSSVTFLFLGIIIFGANIKNNLHWAYAITIISTGLCLALGIIAVKQKINANN